MSICTEHPCDQCETCKNGQCCGEYVIDADLPAEGTWTGTWHGRLGVLEEDSMKGLRCACCGEWFENLAGHVNYAHRINGDTYRAMWGLNCTQPLVSARMRAQRAQRATGRDLSEHRITPEQSSVVGSRRYARSQSQRAGQPLFTAEYQSKASKARWAKPEARAGLVLARRKSLDSRPVIGCSVCGAVYCMVPGKSRVECCGSAECKSAVKTRAAKARWAKRG